MNKNIGVILILAALSLIMVFYLFSSSTRVSFGPGAESEVKVIDKEDVVDLKKIEENHEQEIKLLVDEFGVLLNDVSETILENYSSPESDMLPKEGYVARNSSLKNRLIGLRAPTADFEDLHMNLIISMSRLGAFLESESEEDIRTSQERYFLAKEDFTRLIENKYAN